MAAPCVPAHRSVAAITRGRAQYCPRGLPATQNQLTGIAALRSALRGAGGKAHSCEDAGGVVGKGGRGVREGKLCRLSALQVAGGKNGLARPQRGAIGTRRPPASPAVVPGGKRVNLDPARILKPAPALARKLCRIQGSGKGSRYNASLSAFHSLLAATPPASPACCWHKKASSSSSRAVASQASTGENVLDTCL